MKTIVENLSTFTGLIVGRVYLIVDDDGLTLVDTSLAGAPDKIIRQIEQAGYSAADVKRIIITHAHPDHIGGLPRLKELTGAQVIASEIERPFVQGELPVQRTANSPAKSSDLMPGTPVDRITGEGDRIEEILGGVEILLTPGHAPGHISLWQPERRILICGDVVMNFFGLGLPLRQFTVDMAENIRSIQRLAGLNPAILCTGHGPPVVTEAAEKLNRFARKAEKSG